MPRMQRELRSEVLGCKVTKPEREMIEAHAKKRDMNVSEYLRIAALFDMMMDGNFAAFKHVGSSVARRMRDILDEKLDALMHASADEVAKNWEKHVGVPKR